jgi:hypothetical protein
VGVERIVEARNRAIAEGCTPAEVDQRLFGLIQLLGTGVISEVGFAKCIDPDWLAHLEEDLLETPVDVWTAEGERRAISEFDG